MRILVLSQYWAPENGVPQRRWTWLSKLLVDAGHEVAVIAPPPHYDRGSSIKAWKMGRKSSPVSPIEVGPSGERISRSAYLPSGKSLTGRAVGQIVIAFSSMKLILRREGVLKSFEPDLVIGTVPALPTAVVTRFASRVLKAPYIIDLRDAWPDLLMDAREWNKGLGRKSIREKILGLGPFQIIKTVTKGILNHVLRHASAILVTSDLLRVDMEKRENLTNSGKSPEISTIRNVFPSRTEFYKETHRKDEIQPLHVLYAGTLGRAQNLDNAIEAARLAEVAGIKLELRLVGAGAARTELVRIARIKGVKVIFEKKHDADELKEFYSWADTALVHLTDWEPLNRAVPSKTYELMSAKVHITGVVNGETKRIIEGHNAGHCVPPENPEALSGLWISLAKNRELLNVSSEGKEWVDHVRREVVPARLTKTIEKAASLTNET